MRWVSWWAWAHKLQSPAWQKLVLEGTQSPRVAYAPSTLAPLLGLPGCLSDILMGGAFRPRTAGAASLGKVTFGDKVRRPEWL